MELDRSSRGLCRRFRDWADGQAVQGLRSDRTQAKYVPHEAQSEYWTTRTIGDIIRSRDTIIASTKDIPDYICILSILTYIEGDDHDLRALDYLHEATRHGRDDASLPWTESGPHGIFGDTTVGQKVFNKFVESQWMFYPMPAQPFLTAQPNMPSRAFMTNGKAKFMNDRPIDRRQIFPITERSDSNLDVRRAGRKVVVSYMDIHLPSNQQGERARVPFTVVFKLYPPEEEQSYNAERDGYTAVRDASDTNNILQFLGCFHYKDQEGRQYSTIMSEVADLTLRDLFLGNKIPYELDHVRTIWDGFVGSLYGLATIHNQRSPHGYLCVHQDLKPSNIFLFCLGDTKIPFSYRFKIGDFGSSHARSASTAFHGQNSPDRGATRIYGPPDTFLGDTFDSAAEPSSDVWAMGCIMIELAVWITCGKLGLDKFHDQRVAETKGLKEHENLGRSDCFHDGVEVLKCVKQVQQTVRANRRNHDTITIEMVELALQFALITEKERLTAKQFIPRVQRALKQTTTSNIVPDDSITNGSFTTSPGSISPMASNTPNRTERPGLPFLDLEATPLPNRTSPQQHQDSSATNPKLSSLLPTAIPSNNSLLASTRPNNALSKLAPDVNPHGSAVDAADSSVTRKPYPSVTITEAQERIRNCNGDFRRGLPGYEAVKSLLDSRDFFYLIDNSRHTQKYKETVKDSTTTLFDILIDIDQNGIDVANTSASHSQKTIKTAEKMSRFVDQTFALGVGGDCMIEQALSVTFESIKKRLLPRRRLLSLSKSGSRTQSPRGVTLLVFTNGLWDHQSQDETSGAKTPILSLIKWMQDNEIPRTQLSIQFVQLGTEERGIRKLTILDDKLNKEFDIVDRKPITASIWDILIGSMQEGNDNES